MSKVYFITGANRGLGFTFAEQLSAREGVKVVATARDPTRATELQKLKEERKNIEIITLDITNEESIDQLPKLLSEVAPEGIDVFISNAAISNSFHTVLDTPRSKWLDHYKTNTLGPIYTFQAVYSSLIKKQTREVIFISSLAASINEFLPLSLSAYSQSKAALNYTIKELSSELSSDGFTVVAVSPGLVSTDMGTDSLASFSPEQQEGLKGLFITPEVSVSSILAVTDKLSPEQNGKFLSYDASEHQF